MVHFDVVGGDEKANPGCEGTTTWNAGSEGVGGEVRSGMMGRNSRKDPVEVGPVDVRE